MVDGIWMVTISTWVALVIMIIFVDRVERRNVDKRRREYYGNFGLYGAAEYRAYGHKIVRDRQALDRKRRWWRGGL